jgi:hypothetical protein
MLHVGLDLSRKRVDVCLISEEGELGDELAAPFDEDGLCRLSERVAAKHAGRVRAVVESMNGARFVHDTLEAQWPDPVHRSACCESRWSGLGCRVVLGAAAVSRGVSPEGERSEIPRAA